MNGITGITTKHQGGFLEHSPCSGELEFSHSPHIFHTFLGGQGCLSLMLVLRSCEPLESGDNAPYYFLATDRLIYVPCLDFLRDISLWLHVAYLDWPLPIYGVGFLPCFCCYVPNPLSERYAFPDFYDTRLDFSQVLLPYLHYIDLVHSLRFGSCLLGSTVPGEIESLLCCFDSIAVPVSEPFPCLSASRFFEKCHNTVYMAKVDDLLIDSYRKIQWLQAASYDSEGRP